MRTGLRSLVAWTIHAYTASGVVLALFAVQSTFQYRYREALLWLALQVVVDATDGVLARKAGVATAIPWFSGARLDDLVDYVAYVFVPALLVWRSLLVPGEWVTMICAAMLLSSAYGFSRNDAKTDDHFFTGFPSYWNVVVFYLLLGGWSQTVNGVILIVLAILVFVPLRYVYPSRTPEMRRTTIGFGAAWAILMLWMIWQMPLVPRTVYWVSLSFPIYYLVLSLILDARRRSAVARGI